MTTADGKGLCDKDPSCTEPIAMIDNKGFVYCADHGLDRRGWVPCRKLRPHELRRVLRGQLVARY